MCLLSVGSFQQLRVTSRSTERARSPTSKPPSGDGRNLFLRLFVVVLAESSADDHFAAIDDQRLIGAAIYQNKLASLAALLFLNWRWRNHPAALADEVHRSPADCLFSSGYCCLRFPQCPSGDTAKAGREGAAEFFWETRQCVRSLFHFVHLSNAPTHRGARARTHASPLTAWP